MNAFFTELGRTVLDRWKAENFSLAAFPEIARTALDENPPAEQVDLAELMRDFLFDDAQPFQTASGFGQPELVVFDDPRFYIQLLFWLDGTTDIHQHEFSGAFHVMAGSSLHSHFDFENATSVTANFRVGDVRLKDTQLLETGRTVPIISGRSCIHSLFHLDTPSVTVVVRTHSDPGTGPQFTYLPPHLAVDPGHHDALTIRRKQLLDVLERTDDPEYPEIVRAMLAELDFERGFFVLQNCVGGLRSRGEWDEAWDVFARKHGALAAKVGPTLDEIIRRDGLAALRGTIEEVEHRFFLALLLNVERRSDFFGLVAERYPGDPRETILRWSEELLEVFDEGVRLVDAEFPEELGVDVEEQAEVLLETLRALLECDLGEEMGSSDREFFQALRGAIAGSSLRVLLP